MGDARFAHPYKRLRDATDRAGALRDMDDADVIHALAAASREQDPYLANVLASEASNRMGRAMAITTNLGEGVIATDTRGLIVQVNPKAAQLLARSVAALLRQPLHEVLHGNECESCELTEAMEHEEAVSVDDTDFERGDLGAFPVACTLSPIRLEDAFQGWVLVFQDVTERKQSEARLAEQSHVLEHTVRNALHELHERRRAEVALAESERRFRAIFENAFQFTGLLSPEGRVLEANKAALDFLGRDIEDLRGGFLWDVWGAESEADAMQLRDAVRRGAAGEFVRFEITAHAGDDASHTLDFSIKPVQDIEGRTVLLIPEARDITDRLEYEARVRKSEEMFRGLFENAGVGIAVCDVEGRFARTNPAMDAMLGYAPGELVGKHFTDITYPPDIGPDTRKFREVMEGRLDQYQLEKRYVTKSGDIIWVHVGVSMVRSMDAAPGILVGIVQDVTERHAAEETKARLAAIVEHSSQAIISEDLENTIIDWNPAAESLYGYTQEEAVGRPTAIIMPPESYGNEEALIKSVREGDPIPDMEVERVRKDGARIMVRVTLSPIKSADGELIGVSSLHEDITERKRAERALRENERLFRALFDNAGIGMMLADTSGRLILVNPAFERILGHGPGTLRGHRLDWLSPMDANGAHEAAYRDLVHGDRDLIRMEKRFLKNDGSGIWGNFTLSLIKNDEGRPRFMLGMLEDVTESKALRETQAALADLAEASPEPLLRTDTDGIIQLWNRGCEDVYGYTRDEAIGQNVSLILGADATDPTRAAYDEALRGGRPPPVEVVRRRKDGQQVTVVMNAAPIRDAAGRVVGAAISQHDISDRKRQEEAMRESEARLAEAQALARMTAWEWDLGADAITSSGTAPALFGDADARMSIDAFVRKLREADERRFRAALSEAWRTREPFAMDVRLDKDGKMPQWYHLKAEFAAVPARGPVLRGTAQDVSERKFAELKFSRLLETAPDAMIITDERGRITMVNAETQRIFGYSASELVGRQVELLIPKRYHGGHVQHRQNYFVQPEKRPMGVGLDLHARRKDGSEFPVEISLSPIQTESGLLVSAAIRDVTDRMRQQDALARKAEELARSNEELERFASVASHDIQEPLRVVSGFLRVLERRAQGKLDADSIALVTRAIDGAERAQAIVDGMLTLSRVSTHAGAYERVDVGAVLDDVMVDLARLLHEHDATLTREALPTITADPRQLLQVFENLITNAVKFGPDHPEVRVGARRGEDEWRFFVEDHGPGVPEDERESVFDVFGRGRNSTEAQGSGIGLATVNRIVARHGGRVWVEDTPGGGATFVFTIPDAINEPATGGQGVAAGHDRRPGGHAHGR